MFPVLSAPLQIKFYQFCYINNFRCAQIKMIKQHTTKKKKKKAKNLRRDAHVHATVGHKNFSFCEQTLHKGLIDASCNWLQSTPKNRGQNKFLRKLRAKFQFLRLLFSSLRSISPYNPHTILKNARRGRLKNIFIFIYRSSKYT